MAGGGSVLDHHSMRISFDEDTFANGANENELRFVDIKHRLINAAKRRDLRLSTPQPVAPGVAHSDKPKSTPNQLRAILSVEPISKACYRKRGLPMYSKPQSWACQSVDIA